MLPIPQGERMTAELALEYVATSEREIEASLSAIIRYRVLKDRRVIY